MSTRSACLLLSTPLLAVSVAAQVPTIDPHAPRILAPNSAELAGESISGYPHFQHVRVVHEGGAVELGVDPLLLPGLAVAGADVYVVAAKTVAEWRSDRSLVDVRASGAQAVTFTGAGIQNNTFQLDAGTLSGNAGTGLGVGYDVVIDVNLNGVLDNVDTIDGFGDEAAIYVVRDTTVAGPLGTVEILYSGGSFLGQNTFYPSNIASLGQVPLIVVSHGNGHDYRWYDHIGKHLASYGYVVMSHQNNTGPGSSFASLTTLSNTEYILANQASIGGGVLDGHIDDGRILWIGHSRGGEGVVRAYTRLLNDEFTSTYFDEDDIQMVLSIAPVTHIHSSLSFPDDTNFILMYGSSDSDVSGSPSSSSSKPFAFFERAFGFKHVFYVQGAGHAYFHNGTGSCFCTGPSTLSRSTVHDYELGYILPLVKRYADGNVPALDFFERMDGDLRPAGLAGSVIASKEYREPIALDHFVIDDFQTQTSLAVSSSGGAVTYNVLNAFEGLMRDRDGSFAFSAGVPMNGMTRYDDAGDTWQALVFDWTSPGSYFIEFAVPVAEADLSDDAYLSLRACQGTRHPETDLLNGPLEFTVTLRDTSGTTSSIRTGRYGDITRTYRRTGSGSGAGWANEFSTVRIRLTDFLVDGSGVDLSDVEAVRLEFGSGFGSVRGRLGLDDLEVVGK